MSLVVNGDAARTGRAFARWKHVLVLSVALLVMAACGGGGSSSSALTLMRIVPASVPVSLDQTLEIQGAGFSPGMRLQVASHSLPCDVRSPVRATCTIPARSLPAGRHEARLSDGFGLSDPYPSGLRVNPQPVLLSCNPTEFNAHFNQSLQLTGEGFIPPVRVEFLDAGGNIVGSVMPSVLARAGGYIEADSPIVPGLDGPTPIDVQVINGDGQSARAGMPITLTCGECGERTIDGSQNNETQPQWGAAGARLRVDVPLAYGDSISTPSGATRPNPRAISNAVCAQSSDIFNAAGASDMFWLWGQFLDHDLDLTPEAEPAEPMPIFVPPGDPHFDPFNTGSVVIPLNRSTYDPQSGSSSADPRAHTNEITAWIDGSNVYGSDDVRARALRTNDGSGRLATSAGNLLPFNTAGLPNAPTDQDPTLFLAGDVRCNEQVGLTALHTLFVREHNRVADDIRAKNPALSGDQVYEAARRWVGAEMQVITYKEFLPVLLGPNALSTYGGYDATVDARVGTLFSTAAYRFGHSMVSRQILRLDAAGAPIVQGHLPLRDAFFNPSHIIETGIDPVLRGFAAQTAQGFDPFIVDDLRNFLFGPPGAGGLDLASLNIQRGRDHGLPDYNTCRNHFGLATRTAFGDVTSDPTLEARLTSAYAAIGDMDAWVGALSEDARAGALVGELLFEVFQRQFERLRDGDRFWYQRVFSGPSLQEIERTTLADVIRRNTNIGHELPDDVFHVPAP